MTPTAFARSLRIRLYRLQLASEQSGAPHKCADGNRVLVQVSAQVNAQLMRQKGPLIRSFFNLLGGRLARPVPGFGFNPNQHRIIASVCSLQGGGKFKAVGRYDAIVMVSGGDHRRWVLSARL